MAGTERTPPAWSLRWRVLLAGAAVVTVFVVLTGIAVDRAFRDSIDAASRERLLARIYLLMGAAEVDADGRLSMPAELSEPRLATPGSGAYAAITGADGELLWRSDSSIGLDIAYPGIAAPGDTRLNEAAPSATGPLQSLAYPVFWELENGDERVFVFQAAESRAALDAEVAAFRSTLRWWLGGGAIALLLLQAGVLIWSLAPVGRVADEIGEIEAGTREALGFGYPRELSKLTDNLNALIESRETRLRRYRNALGDLAHSLKTPLAVLRADSDARRDSATVREQLDRMEESIEYHLQRAAYTGRSPLAAPVAVRPAALRLIESLQKIYRDKSLQMECDIPPDAWFAGDPGDLAEMLGNLGDNACKWSRSWVRFSARNVRRDGAEVLELRVEDDGPGIPEELRRAVLGRGVRVDTRLPGQGIGLAVVRETVESIYGGTVQIEPGTRGGTCVELRIG